MQSRLTLTGHGMPPAPNDFKQIPLNGQMIRMIPGTCPPVHTIPTINWSLLNHPFQPASDIIQTLNSVHSTQTNAFSLYEPNQPYSDQYIQVEFSSITKDGEDGMLKEYAYSYSSGFSVVNKTRLLKPMPGPDGNMYVKLSDVHDLLSKSYQSYLLIAVCCVSTGIDAFDAYIQEKVKQTTIAGASSYLFSVGYAGGKNVRSSMRKKRRTSKTHQRKKNQSKNT
jgi:hypothetical protein